MKQHPLNLEVKSALRPRSPRIVACIAAFHGNWIHLRFCLRSLRPVNE
jgi:hypothetical protein